MISFVRGELSEILENVVVVDNNGVGYNVEVPFSVISGLPAIGSEVKLYTYLSVREDAMKLFGFLTRDDLNIFKLLIGVSGIGPKGALAILSAMTPNDLRIAVMSDDAKAIAKAPGIGLKTAQKLIIEAKGKISMPDYMDSGSTSLSAAAAIPEDADPRAEAIAALTALGYSNSEAVLAVKKVEYTDGMDAEAVLKASLKHLTFL
ncbi:MAG: Holliday junction branch migration protein RuvA [Thermoflexaceae bacterium]|nr:Holliday junction branch migration protein RuvA [Thermoflexaceae bacterium]